MRLPSDRKKILTGVLIVLAVAVFLRFFFGGGAPVSDSRIPVERTFAVRAGDGVLEIAKNLRREGFIRSPSAFAFFAFIRGKARSLQAGRFTLYDGMGLNSIITVLASGDRPTALVTIHEGWTVFDIDKRLAEAGIIVENELVAYNDRTPVEGRLFPDTYRFFRKSTVEEVVGKFLARFDEKAAPILNEDEENFEKNLIIASMVEREIPDDGERRIVAGILKKRLADGMPLQVDATLCYSKQHIKREMPFSCLPLTGLDLKIESPYNTYLYKGLPQGPIANPGVSSLSAAVNSEKSPYWFYLSNPATKKTIFARTFEEHTLNIARYLRSR